MPPSLSTRVFTSAVLERPMARRVRRDGMIGVTSSLHAPNTDERCPGYAQNTTIYTRLAPPSTSSHVNPATASHVR